MATAGDDLVCTTCGATALGGPDLPAGASAAGPARGREADLDPRHRARRCVWTCERCSRAHLRSIEAKLDQAWW